MMIGFSLLINSIYFDSTGMIWRLLIGVFAILAVSPGYSYRIWSQDPTAQPR